MKAPKKDRRYPRVINELLNEMALLDAHIARRARIEHLKHRATSWVTSATAALRMMPPVQRRWLFASIGAGSYVSLYASGWLSA